MSHKTTTVWKENLIFESDNPGGYTFNVGQSPEKDEKNKPLRPKALMLSSLAGCSGLDIVSILEKMKSKVDDIKIETSGELTDEHPRTYHTVTVDYHFYGSNLDEDKINKAVTLSIDKYCGVMEMFKQFAEVKTAIHFHNK